MLVDLRPHRIEGIEKHPSVGVEDRHEHRDERPVAQARQIVSKGPEGRRRRTVPDNPLRVPLPLCGWLVRGRIPRRRHARTQVHLEPFPPHDALCIRSRRWPPSRGRARHDAQYGQGGTQRGRPALAAEAGLQHLPAGGRKVPPDQIVRQEQGSPGADVGGVAEAGNGGERAQIEAASGLGGSDERGARSQAASEHLGLTCPVRMECQEESSGRHGARQVARGRD